MKNNVTDYNQINIKNNFMFCTVMRKPELCKEFLERILGSSIKKIQYIESEKTIDHTVKAKSIRLDVYLNDENGTIYNIEMQKSDTLEIPKRSRYYSSLIDLDFLKKGQDYNDLPKSIVLFVCDFDLFAPNNKALYCFENRCIDDTELSLNDGTMKIFVNIKGNQRKVSEKMKSLLEYFDTGVISDEFTACLENEVVANRNNEQWRLEYMTLQLALKDEYKHGKQAGKIELIQSLIEDGTLTIEAAAEKLNLSVEQLEKKFSEPDNNV